MITPHDIAKTLVGSYLAGAATVLLCMALVGCCDLAPEADNGPLADAGGSPLSVACAESQTFGPASDLETTWIHTLDDQGRRVRTEIDFDGDGLADEVITRSFDDHGRQLEEAIDGGQEPPDGVTDGRHTWFYECSP